MCSSSVVRLKCFVLKNIKVLSSTCGECAPNCLHSHRCSSSTRVTMYSAKNGNQNGDTKIITSNLRESLYNTENFLATSSRQFVNVSK